MEKLNTYYNTSLTRWLMAALFILLVASLSAQVAGDYKTKWGYGSSSAPSSWSYYNGVGWVNAAQSPSSPFPVGNTIYLDHFTYCDQNMVLAGKIVMSNGGTLQLRNGAHLEISSTGIVENKAIQVDKGCKITNNGQINSAFLGATIILNEGDANNTTTLINNGKIQLTDDGNAATYNLQMKGNSVLISGSNGYIYGNGSMSATAHRKERMEIAGPSGFDPADGAVRLTGSNNIGMIHYVFKGTQAQHTGNLPSPIWSLEINNPAGVKLDKDLMIYGNDPTSTTVVKVNNGSVLDMGDHFIQSTQKWGGTAKFTLEDGATLITKHKDGISSIALNDRIVKGCMQTNEASYSSQANYTFNRDGEQHSGIFTTTPTPNTVHNLTVGRNTDIIWGGAGAQPPIYTGTFNNGDDTLPVTLSSFTATIVGLNNVRISWVTASETNCLGYNIWRADSADLTRATRISSMIQAENSSQGAYYVFTDTGLYEEGTYYYWLEDISINYESQFHGHIYVRLDFQGDNHSPEIVERTGFKSNHPNPFNPSTTLRYGLSQDSDLTITFYNLRGQVIDSKQLSNQSKGMHSLVWNTRDLGIPSGVYFARLTSKSGSDLLKITLSE